MMSQDEDVKYPMHPSVHGIEGEDRYLKAQDPSTHRKPEDIDTWGDYFLRPDKPLNQRQLELCRMAAHGKTNIEIAAKLNYSQNRVSSLLGNQKIKDQIQEYRDALFGVDTKTRLKELAPDATNVLADILKDEHMTLKEKEKAAMWVLEKVDGKAAQQTDINVTGGVGFFLDKLDQAVKSGNLKGIKDVTPELGGVTNDTPVELEAQPASKEVQDDFSSWLDSNLKEPEDG